GLQEIERLSVGDEDLVLPDRHDGHRDLLATGAGGPRRQCGCRNGTEAEGRGHETSEPAGGCGLHLGFLLGLTGRFRWIRSSVLTLLVQIVVRTRYGKGFRRVWPRPPTACPAQDPPARSTNSMGRIR